MKYLFQIPIAVKIVGWIHGILFMLFFAALIQAKVRAKWPLGRAILVFVAGLLPFGPFVVDRRMLSYDREFRNQSKEGTVPRTP